MYPRCHALGNLKFENCDMQWPDNSTCLPAQLDFAVPAVYGILDARLRSRIAVATRCLVTCCFTAVYPLIGSLCSARLVELYLACPI